MANNTQLWYRRLFPTAHKLLLDQNLFPRFKTVRGDTLVIGAGKVDYRRLLPLASSIIATDIDPGEFVDMVVDAHSLPFEDKSIDTVIAIEVFEHLRDPRAVVEEITRVLRVEGRVLLSVPFMFRVHGDPHDYQRFTQSGLATLFGEGFEIHIQPFGNRFHVVSDIISTAFRPLIVFRGLNHLLCCKPLTRASRDCPSGYIAEVKKKPGHAFR
jgi:SAM-dependent methyltransferase